MAKALAAAIAALVFLSSCVTSSDLRRLEEAQASYRMEVDRTLVELESDAITERQAEEQIEDAQSALREELEATIAQVEERTKAVAKAAGHIPTDPLSLITYVAGIGAAVAGSSKLAERRVNEKRDMARRLRGEPTAGGPTA
jgi:hypothetical protein